MPVFKTQITNVSGHQDVVYLTSTLAGAAECVIKYLQTVDTSLTYDVTPEQVTNYFANPFIVSNPYRTDSLLNVPVVVFTFKTNTGEVRKVHSTVAIVDTN